MNYESFIKKVLNLPVIDTDILIAGEPNLNMLKVQITRWQKAGKLIKLKRGVYVLPQVYRKVEPDRYHVASVLKKPSYISLEKALEIHHLIPEAVYVITSVTTKRPGRFVNALGDFEYRSLQPSLFWGYEPVIYNDQTAFVASPEKALLDYFYLKHDTLSLDYLEESMRLQNVEDLDIDRLFKYAAKFKKPRVMQYAKVIAEYKKKYEEEYKQL